MRNSLTSKLSIGLSKTGVGLIRSDGWPRARHSAAGVAAETAPKPAAGLASGFAPDLAPGLSHGLVPGLSPDSAPDLPPPLASPEHLAEQLRAALAQARWSGLSASITLADTWVRYFMVTPPQNTGRFSDCGAACDMRFRTLYGEAPDGWLLQADWDARHPFLACALPRALLASQQQVALDHKLALVAVAPHFIAAWNRWRGRLKPGAWFGVAQGGTLTLGAPQQRRLCAVRSAPFPAEAWQDKAALPGHLRREALRLNLPPPDTLHLCGQVGGFAPGQASLTLGGLTLERLDAVPLALDGTPPNLAGELALARCGVAA